MTRDDVEIQKSRLAKFERLTSDLETFREALNKIESDDPSGPCGQGPFTGNTRESRDVYTMHIYFSRTKGGSPPVEMYIQGLELDALKLREVLVKDLREKIKALESKIFEV